MKSKLEALDVKRRVDQYELDEFLALGEGERHDLLAAVMLEYGAAAAAIFEREPTTWWVMFAHSPEHVVARGAQQTFPDDAEIERWARAENAPVFTMTRPSVIESDN